MNVITERYSLYEGDCLEVMKTLEPASIVLAFIDIPYGLGVDTWDVEISGLESFALVRPLMMPGGSIYATCTSHILRTVSAYMNVRRVISWCKPNLPLRKNLNEWEWSTEFVLWETIGEPRVFNKPDGENSRDYWRLYVENGFLNPDGNNHPARKPVSLLKRIIEASTQPGDIVLDPFLGSGTAGEVAIKLGRRFIGIEKLHHWFDEAAARCADAHRAANGLNKQLRGKATDTANMPLFADRGD